MNIYTYSLISLTILLLLFGFFFFKKKKKKNELKKRVLADGTTDYRGTAMNIALSISKSRELYKELIIKVHPDRFQNEKKITANELSSRITKSKKNYDELSKLKIEVDAFLNDKL